MKEKILSLYEKYKGGELLRFVRFGLVGVSNTAVDFVIFWLLSVVLSWSVYPSQVISYSTATVNSYVLNHKWTFKSGKKLGGAEFVKFVCVNLMSLGASLLLMRLFFGVMGLPKMVCKVLIAFFTIAINYLGNRLWVFKAAAENKENNNAGA